mmetsp:Transcript_19798/g.54569  ORF Transcript_19798/g.54569 Transcript_19798/m.54569 type:complete len:261 (-) Transcript_19798:1574-2356(-)
MSTLSSSSATCLRVSSLSCRICLPFHALSPEIAALRALPSSSCAVLRRTCNFASSPTYEAGVSRSSTVPFCFAVTAFLASTIATAATFSASRVRSLISLSFPTLNSSRLFSMSGSTAVDAAFTLASASTTFSMTLWSSIVVFRNTVSRLKETDCCTTASARLCNCSSSSVVDCLTAMWNVGTSSARAFKKVRAWFAAASTVRKAFSQFAMASIASGLGISSTMPFKKGASATAVSPRHSSAFSTFSKALRSIVWTCTCSD